MPCVCVCQNGGLVEWRAGKEERVMLRPSGRIKVRAAAEREQRRFPQRSQDQRARYADRH